MKNYLLKLKAKFSNFMIGRYGDRDEFSGFLKNIIFILLILNLFMRKNNVLNFIIFFLMAIFFYRYFSKNIQKRYLENHKYLKLINPIKRNLTRFNNNIKDKNYKYIQCKNCTQELKVPKRKGKIKVTCKNCKNEFEIRT